LVAKLIEDLRAQFPGIHAEEVDITERPDVAVRYRVLATPAVAINGQLAFTGVPSEAALRARVAAAAREGLGQ
jgi:hypothetical protein